MPAPTVKFPIVARRFMAYATVGFDGNSAAHVYAQSGHFRTIERVAIGRYLFYLKAKYALLSDRSPGLIVAPQDESDPIAYHVGAGDTTTIEVILWNMDPLAFDPPEPMTPADYVFTLLILEPLAREFHPLP